MGGGGGARNCGLVAERLGDRLDSCDDPDFESVGDGNEMIISGRSVVLDDEELVLITGGRSRVFPCSIELDGGGEDMDALRPRRGDVGAYDNEP